MYAEEKTGVPLWSKIGNKMTCDKNLDTEKLPDETTRNRRL